jgi:hypothetical protein
VGNDIIEVDYSTMTQVSVAGSEPPLALRRGILMISRLWRAIYQLSDRRLWRVNVALQLRRLMIASSADGCTRVLGTNDWQPGSRRCA